MRTKITIESIDSSILKELFKEVPNKKGFSITLEELNTTIYYDSYPSKKAFPTNEIVNIIVEFGSSVSVGLFTSWLYDKLKSKTKTIHIGKEKNVELNEKEIEKKINENIE